jgi:hypothetical protein
MSAQEEEKTYPFPFIVKNVKLKNIIMQSLNGTTGHNSFAVLTAESLRVKIQRVSNIKASNMAMVLSRYSD